MINVRSGCDIVLSEESIKRLPMICQQIIHKQRAIDTLCESPVANMSEFLELKKDMRMLVKRAGEIFAPEPRSD